jgi:hypothetical protein
MKDKRILIGAAALGLVAILGLLGLGIGAAMFFGSGETAANNGPSDGASGLPGAPADGSASGGAGSSQPSVIPLTELNTSAWQMAPWPSKDGLRLYYEASRNGMGIYMASRPNVNAKFGAPVFVADGRHPSLTEDELGLVCLGNGTNSAIMFSKRTSRDVPFPAPQPIPGLQQELSPKSPWISGNGMELLFQRGTAGGVEIAETRRISSDASWATPISLPLWTTSVRGKPPTWPWRGDDHKLALWGHGGDEETEIWTARRVSTNATFGDFQPVKLDGQTLLGRSPRWCAATGELFFSRVRPDGAPQKTWELAVVKNFWPLGKPKSTPSPTNVAAGENTNESAPVQPPQGYTALFNGTDLTGWEVMQTTGTSPQDQSVHTLGSGGWEVRKGDLVCTTAVPGWLKTKQQYGDFDLQLEFKLPAGGNSGIYIRSPDAGHLSHTGMEVQVIETAASGGSTGTIAHAGVPAVSNELKRGEWNRMQIRCEGDDVRISVNGKLVAQTDMGTNDKLRDRPRRGYIGLANWMGQAQNIEFRNIWIKELLPAQPPTSAAGWQPLFPGDDISAWKGKSGMWNMKSGDLFGNPSTPASYSFLFSPKPYADFELQFQARLRNDQDNSGVQIRSEVLDTTEWSARGPQVEVGGTGAWGGLYGEQLQVHGGWLVKPTRSPAIKRDDFNDYFVRCVGKHVTITVNGVTTVDEDVPSMADAGLIAFQVHRRNTGDVTFRNIQIRELNVTPSTAGSAPSNAPADAQQFGGHAYKFYPVVLNWKEARAQCAAMGGHLVVIDSLQENTFVGELVAKGGGQDCWIGITDEVEEGKWLTVDGQSLTYTNWRKGQPNNKANAEHFALISNRVFGGTPMNWQWSDQPKTALEKQHQPGYMCEWEATGTTTGGPGWQDLTDADFITDAATARTLTWKDGVLSSRGTQQNSVLRSKREFDNFELIIQWRALDDMVNAGIFVWTPAAGLASLAPGKTPPAGVELQVLAPGFVTDYEQKSKTKADWFTAHGDVLAFGSTTMKPFAPASPRGLRSLPKKQLCKPTGEWNEYHVRCENGAVRLSVNGEEVAGGSDISPAHGAICLQLPSLQIEFRGMRVRELPTAGGVATTPPASGNGWLELFNGHDLAGWEETGTTGGWAVKGGELVAAGKAQSARQAGWLMTEREFADFELQLEFAIDEKTDSGVAFRCDRTQTTGTSQAEVQILDQADPQFMVPYDRLPYSRSGALSGLSASGALSALARNQWHKLHISCIGRKLKVMVNDQVTVDTDLDEHVDQARKAGRTGILRPAGPIGLQRLLGSARYRNIRIRDLGGNTAPPAAWVDLFNGRELTGWREFVTSGQWAVAGGVIATPGGQGGGWLATEKEYTDFELELEYKHPPRGNSGVFLRMPDDTANPIGGQFLEVQLMTENASSQAIHRAGGVYRVLPAEIADTPAGAWHKLKIRAVGPEITTWINDKQIASGNVDTATVTGNPIPHLKRRTGRIGLQRHGTAIEFRNIRIKELP